MDGNIAATDVIPVKYTGPNSRGRYTIARPRTNLKRLYGLVGSEATIADSTNLPTDTDVTMEWRARTKGEADNVTNPTTKLPVKDPTTPDGADWLTSDVVKIGGIGSGSVYALQMTFDNRINEALDQGGAIATLAHNSGAAAAVHAERDGLYIAEAVLTTSGSVTTAAKWTKPADIALGSKAELNVDMSLADFLASKLNGTTTLADLVGSWGLDDAAQSPAHPYGVNSTGQGYSWAIVAGGGSGIFAVVPEPTSLALLITAGLGLAIYGLRRLRKPVA